MTTEDRATWLAGLSPGDEVVVSTSFHAWIETVARRAAGGGIVTTAGLRFDRDGRERDADCLLVEPTPERREEIQRRALVTRLRATAWDALPLATLRRVGACLEGGEDGK